MTRNRSEDIGAETVSERPVLYTSLLALAGISPGIFLAFSFYLMRSLPYSISAILGVLLAAIGIYVVTHKEPRLRIRRSFRIAAVLQVSLVMILLEISGILKLHHVADPIFFFSFLIIFVISCLLSHFVSSQVEKLYS